MRKHDKKFLEFPLCLLAFNSNKWIDKIISFSIIDYSKKIEIAIEARINRVSETPSDFDYDNEIHFKIVLAAEEMGITIGTIKSTLNNYHELEKFVQNFSFKHGKQPYCRVGKNLCFEARDGQFDEMLFRIYCAIQSKLGKKKHFRYIYKDEIRCRMRGYKTNDVMNKEKPKGITRLTNKMIKKYTDILAAKKLISKFTYRKRLTYYSTRLTKEKLIEEVKKTKIFWAEHNSNLRDNEASEDIKNELDKIKKRNKVKIFKVPTDEILKEKTGTS